MHLESKQFSLLQTKLGGFTHTSTPQLSQPNLKNVNNLLTFVKTQVTSITHLIIMGHHPQATWRKLNVRKPYVRHPTHLYHARIDKRDRVPDDTIRMPDLPNVLITNKVNINGITPTALLATFI